MLELPDHQREQARADIDVVHGRYSIDGHELRRQLESSAQDTAAAPYPSREGGRDGQDDASAARRS